MKIVFDASVHLGQFAIDSEEIRIACKNSQIAISAMPRTECVGIVSFNENSWVDHLVWKLERPIQEVFYKFMDEFHSVKNILRIPMGTQDSKIALDLSSRFGLDISNALTCAIAISQEAGQIHTYYEDLPLPKITKFMKSEYDIGISIPPAGKELKYPEKNLENYYQKSLKIFRAKKLDLAAKLHKIV